MRTLPVICALAVLAFAFLPAQSLEDKARAKFEAEGAGNMSKADMILLLHEYKRCLDWELKRGMEAKFRVGQLEIVVQNLVNDLMAVQYHRNLIKSLKDEETKLTAEILQLKGEAKGLQRRIDDLKRTRL